MKVITEFTVEEEALPSERADRKYKLIIRDKQLNIRHIHFAANRQQAISSLEQDMGYTFVEKDKGAKS